MKEVLMQVKVKKPFAVEVDKLIKSGLFSTRSEFLRDSMRQNLLKFKSGVVIEQMRADRERISPRIGATTFSDKEKDKLVKKIL